MYEYYEFVVFPFGLANATTTFIFLMHSALCPYLDKFVIVFIDDICIYYNNEEEHAKHLSTILIFLRQHELSAKLRKCSFF